MHLGTQKALEGQVVQRLSLGVLVLPCLVLVPGVLEGIWTLGIGIMHLIGGVVEGSSGCVGPSSCHEQGVKLLGS